MLDDWMVCSFMNPPSLWLLLSHDESSLDHYRHHRGVSLGTIMFQLLPEALDNVREERQSP